MLADNYRALSLMKRMGFSLTYSDDGTVDAILDLRGGRGPALSPAKGPSAIPTEGEFARLPSTIRSVERTPPAIDELPPSSDKPKSAAG